MIINHGEFREPQANARRGGAREGRGRESEVGATLIHSDVSLGSFVRFPTCPFAELALERGARPLIRNQQRSVSLVWSKRAH